MKNRKNFLVIGNPIKHSLSPFLHNYWFHKNKINCEYKKLKTTKSSIKQILNRVRKREIEGERDSDAKAAIPTPNAKPTKAPSITPKSAWCG